MRAQITATSATGALVIHTFVPDSRQPSASQAARLAEQRVQVDQREHGIGGREVIPQ